MPQHSKADEYINRHPKWSSELAALRKIFLQTKLKEEIKWGTPTYTLNGKLVAGIAAFKNHYALWFHQGVFLSDPEDKLVNAQKGVTKALRQWKFTCEDAIDSNSIRKYIEEAIKNCEAGKEIKPIRKKSVSLPPEILLTRKTDNVFKKAFDGLTDGKKREYADYISLAKKDITKQSRLEKIIPMIKSGKGLHDKYKK